MVEVTISSGTHFQKLRPVNAHPFVVSSFSYSFWKLREPRREDDRQRAQARKSQVKQRDDGLTPEQRRERDAKALQEKAAKKAAQAAVGVTTDSKNKDNAKK
ncbi:unnamed protein product [Musa acuminata subsp. malaccensis]|uniref:(wild Malaysian banana) hypothetical protein n=1 Tax=Musa acuminata subsp. malaccensis TaxID=214687 RepID=A0A804KBY6_MUSAM|nr:unnamed protein product [Musa acuminata subsp. malaccensis]